MNQFKIDRDCVDKIDLNNKDLVFVISGIS
jgi:hypothetical protein